MTVQILIARLEFQPRDFWIGAYWKPCWSLDVRLPVYTDLWVCLVPMFPLHLRWRKFKWPKK